MTRTTDDKPGGGKLLTIPVIDRAVYILEEIDAQRWLRIHELTTIHLRGELSYEGWRTACSAIIEHVARRLEP